MHRSDPFQFNSACRIKAHNNPKCLLRFSLSRCQITVIFGSNEMSKKLKHHKYLGSFPVHSSSDLRTLSWVYQKRGVTSQKYLLSLGGTSPRLKGDTNGRRRGVPGASWEPSMMEHRCVTVLSWCHRRAENVLLVGHFPPDAGHEKRGHSGVRHNPCPWGR